MQPLYGIVKFSVGFLAVAYVAYLAWGAPKVWVEIRKMCLENLLPRKWLLLAALPLLSHWLIKKQLRSTRMCWPQLQIQNPEINLDVARPIRIDNVQWLLFSKQREKRSGDQIGTRFYPLEAGSNCYEFYPVDGQRDEDEHKIPVGVPYHLYKNLEHPWARLYFDSYKQHWKLKNISRNGIVIPKYQLNGIDDIDDDSFEFIQSGERPELILRNGDFFVIGFVEFQIVRLPTLGVFRSDLGEDVFLRLPLKHSVWIGHSKEQPLAIRKLCYYPKTEVCKYKHIKLRRNMIEYVAGDITYISSSGIRRILEKGVVMCELTPGDQFYIGDPEKIYRVDYIIDPATGGMG